MQEKNERYKKEYHAKYKQDENRKTVQKSRCPYAKKCGGCQFIDMPYEKQLERKQKELKALRAYIRKNHTDWYVLISV